MSVHIQAARLQDKVAIITGATSGIGEATARVFAAHGAKLVIAGRSQERGEALAQELKALYGDRFMFHAVNVIHDQQMGALVDATVERFGRLDCLFNNAGAGERSSVESVTEEEFDRVMRLLVGSAVFGMKHAARVMKTSGGGSIINNATACSSWCQPWICYFVATNNCANHHMTWRLYHWATRQICSLTTWIECAGISITN
jgi:NAD(P)-dependent dehydrogenase (short-subunit alcohol dehydrogenase family)